MSKTKAKSAVPKLRLVRPGGGRRKFVALLVLVALVVWVVKDPRGAAHTVSTVVDAVVTFCRALGA